nr:hypothetical protein [Tanacetum cinerariifolium]
KEFVSANSDAKIKSFSPSPILVMDIDFLMEEIDLFCTPDYPMSSGIEDKDYDFERDILIHQEKSPDLLSHRGLKSFSPFATCPMMIHGQNNHILDVLLFHFSPP